MKVQTKTLNLCSIFLLAAVAVAGPVASPVRAAEQFLTIATGPLTGVYYPAGRAICDIVNRRVVGTRCSAWRTAGSDANMDALADGAAELAIVQNDVARTRSSQSVAQVMRLHRDYLTVIVRADDPATTLTDLPFRELYTGSPGSGHRASAIVIAKALGRKLRKPSSTQSDLISPPLCAGSVRGLMLMVGQPAGMVQEAIRSCDARIIGLDEATIARLTEVSPVYARATIPAGLYRGQDQAIATVGQASILMARTDLPADLVQAIVAAIYADLDQIKAAHPALQGLELEGLRALDSTLPVHPGASSDYTANR